VTTRKGGNHRKKNGAPRGGVLRAIHLMTRDPVTVPDSMTIAELCDLFQEKNINGAPVVDGAGRLVGVVAQDDIIYGAMGNPDTLENGRPAAAGPEAGTGPGPGDGAPAKEGRSLPASDSHARRRRRNVVAMLRDRNLKALPDLPPRPGEAPFWAEDRRASDPLRMPVSAIMTSPAISAKEQTPVSELCNVMWNLKIHRVPIVRGGRVTGIVSSLDLCRAILAGLIKA
jgi:CBS domain-containing protein